MRTCPEREADFPVTDWAPGDAYTDCGAFRSGVIAALDERLSEATEAFVTEDATAKARQADRGARLRPTA